MSDEAISHFSTRVDEAHDKFAAAARAAGATLEEIVHPLKGPHGETIRVGIAVLGDSGSAKALLVLSGTHGVEGFAGAAIQTGVLRNAKALGPLDDMRLVFVHLINPWGAAWDRREDHENIDLFRNFLYTDMPATPDPLFDVWDDAMDLAHLGERSHAETLAIMRRLVAEHGEARLIAAVRRGQHHRPKSLTYHGQGPCWSKRVLDGIVARHLKGAREIAVLDIHTGFGPYGHGMPISYDPDGDPRQNRVRAWMGEEIYVPGNDADTPPHPQSPFEAIGRQIPGASVTAAILEYGTFPPEETRDLFIASLYYQLYGDPNSKEGLEVRRRTKRFCYPEEDDWKTMVWVRGRDIVGRMIAGLKAWDSGLG